MRVFFRCLAVAFSGGLLLALAACAAPGSPGGEGEGWPGDRTFIATTVTDGGAAKALVEGTRITLSFGTDGRVSAHAGCNSMGGTGRIEAGVLLVDGLSMTEMGCPDGRMEQDAWVAELLTSGPALELDGDNLTLTGTSITMVLLDREIADPDRPLASTPWTVHTVFEGDSASNTIHPVPAVLTIDPDGSFHATTGCVGGELRGTVTVAGDVITFAVTGEQPCVGGGNLVDEAVRATLAGEVTYEIEAASLRLLRPDGNGLGLSAEGSGGDGQVEVDCGTVTLGQRDPLPEAALTCFLEAVAASQTVHLTIVWPTVEGDPVPTTYRGDGSGGIQVTIDTRQDRFGTGVVQHQLCEEPIVADGVLTFARCTDTGTG